MFRLQLPRWLPPHRTIPLAAAHVVARPVPAAPCGWVFFDGGETRVAVGDGNAFVIPGGAFFPREARRFASADEAEAEACRLNDRSLCLDRPWRAGPTSAFLPQRQKVSHTALANS